LFKCRLQLARESLEGETRSNPTVQLDTFSRDLKKATPRTVDVTRAGKPSQEPILRIQNYDAI